MRILLLSDIDSSHTRKWAVSLHERGYTIGIFSLRRGKTNWCTAYKGIEVFDAEGFSDEKFQESASSKVSYLKTLPHVRQCIRLFRPDIVHAHYATSYGLLGAESGFHPLVISVWGSDVFDFPRRSFIHRWLLRRNLKKADFIFSTSEVMKKEVVRLGIPEVTVTPFGVNIDVYKPQQIQRRDGGVKVIGTVKTLERHYGIDILINAFAMLKKTYASPLQLVICGSGTQEKALKELAVSTGYNNDIVFKGHIPQEEVPDYIRRFDIFANLSREESFGVAVIEAMACGVPVVVSDAPGLVEVTAQGKYGIVVPRDDVKAAADALLRLLDNSTLDAQLRQQGRQHVEANYNWERNLDAAELIYREIVTRKSRTA
jgi:L-malate glycosyltransferase